MQSQPFLQLELVFEFEHFVNEFLQKFREIMKSVHTYILIIEILFKFLLIFVGHKSVMEVMEPLL